MWTARTGKREVGEPKGRVEGKGDWGEGEEKECDGKVRKGGRAEKVRCTKILKKWVFRELFSWTEAPLRSGR